MSLDYGSYGPCWAPVSLGNPGSVFGGLKKDHGAPHGGAPNIDPKILSSLLWGPPNVTPHSGKPPYTPLYLQRW